MKKPLVGYNRKISSLWSKVSDLEIRVEQPKKQQQTFSGRHIIRSIGVAILETPSGQRMIAPYTHSQVSNNHALPDWSGPAWNAMLDRDDAEALVSLLLQALNAEKQMGAS